MTTFTGTSGNDTENGTSGGDFFNMNDGGNDTVNGNAGNDVATFAGTFTSADKFNGGTGYDSLILSGNYAAGVTLLSTTLTGVEEIDMLGSTNSYKLIMNNANVASGQTLVVSAANLDAAHTLYFDAAGDINSLFTVTSGAGNDTIKLNSLADTINSGSGNDAITITGAIDSHGIINTGAGNDTIYYAGDAFNASNQIDGGSGSDTLILDGYYGDAVYFTATTLLNVETIQLTTGNNYDLELNEATIGAGQSLFIDASALFSTDFVHLYSYQDMDSGAVNAAGGAGDDIFSTGAGNDQLFGNGGNDGLNPGTGNDVADGGAGDDTISMVGNFAELNAADQLDGGTGNDTLSIYNDYSSMVTTNATTFKNFETMKLGGDFNYYFTFADGNIGAGQQMIVSDTAQMLATATISIDDSAETDGNLAFDLVGKETLIFRGGAGNDNVSFEATSQFKAADQINAGGGGGNGIEITGDYSTQIVFNSNTIKNIQTVGLSGADSFNFVLADGNIAAGKSLIFYDSGEAAGQTITIDASAETNGSVVFSFAGPENLVLTGGDGSDTFTGGTGTNVFNGGAGADIINIGQGSPKTANGGAGADSINGGAGFVALDSVDGGTANDTLSLNGNYNITFGAATIVNVETLSLASGHTYNITTNDGNVAAGQTLAVNGGGLLLADILTFNGAAETDGLFSITGGASNDTLTGGAKNDTFNLTKGGSDVVSGGGGNDTFNFGAAFSASDSVDGGAGVADTVKLDGDYSAGVVFSATTLINVETVALAAGNSYALTTNDATVANGIKFTVDGSALLTGQTLHFNGAAEADHGLFVVKGGAGADVIVGGNGADTFTGGLGADSLTGNAGADTFIYGGVNESTGPAYDTLVSVSLNADKIDLDVAVTGTDTAVTTGTLSSASFNADLAGDLGAAKLAIGHAVLFTADAGTLSGHTFLVVDHNGVAGYQGDLDYVFEVTGGILGGLNTATFI